jgi:hypothetical protein
MFLASRPPRSVPWTSWEEWQEVYHWLYSLDSDEQLLGIKRVAAWKTRGKLPISIECTSTLIEIKRKDKSEAELFQQSTMGGFSSSDQEKKLLYSMALSRMVNGLVEPLQTGMYAVSIQQLARQIGLPEELVELRHQASHKDLPSITLLRNAAEDALEWLRTNYWRAQLHKLQETRQNIIEELKKYNVLLKEFTADASKKDSKNRKKITQKVNKCLQSISTSVSPSQVNLVFIPLLLDYNFMIPKTTVSLGKVTELPNRIENMWMKLLNFLAGSWPRFLDNLLLSIATRVASTDDSDQSDQKMYYNSMLVCWFRKLLSMFVKAKNRDAKNDPTRGKHVFRTIIQMCMSNINGWTASVMKMAIVYCGFDRDTKVRVAQVFSFHLKIERIQKLEQLTPENFAIIHAKEQNEIMLNEGSFEEELENGDENDEIFEKENEDEEMNEDENNEDEDSDEMDQEDNANEDDEEDSDNDHMDEYQDEQSDSEVVVPVELEDFEKLLQSKELAMKAVKSTQKQINNDDNNMEDYYTEEDVESIWKPVHKGFGCGIGVLLNGQLPNLELPAELDELKGASFYILDDRQAQTDVVGEDAKKRKREDVHNQEQTRWNKKSKAK